MGRGGWRENKYGENVSDIFLCFFGEMVCTDSKILDRACSQGFVLLYFMMTFILVKMLEQLGCGRELAVRVRSTGFAHRSALNEWDGEGL